jgi:hypothetical protein
MCGAIYPLPHTLHGVVLSTGYVFMVWYLVKHRGNFAVTSLRETNPSITPTDSDPQKSHGGFKSEKEVFMCVNGA